MVSTVTNDPRVIVRGDISYTSKMGGGRVGWDRDSAMSYRTLSIVQSRACFCFHDLIKHFVLARFTCSRS